MEAGAQEPMPPRAQVADVPRDLESICCKALRKDPGQRYPTASAFAEDATLTVQTAGVTFTGHDEIGRMFTDFFADWDSMVHEITNLVVDTGAAKVSTEQHVDLNRNGTTKMHNCNFFDVDEEGKFSRVIIWMDGTNPLN